MASHSDVLRERQNGSAASLWNSNGPSGRCLLLSNDANGAMEVLRSLKTDASCSHTTLIYTRHSISINIYSLMMRYHFLRPVSPISYSCPSLSVSYFRFRSKRGENLKQPAKHNREWCCNKCLTSCCSHSRRYDAGRVHVRCIYTSVGDHKDNDDNGRNNDGCTHTHAWPANNAV